MRTSVICTFLVTAALLSYFLFRIFVHEGHRGQKDIETEVIQIAPTAHYTKRVPAPKEQRDTPEAKNARIMAEFKRTYAKVAPLLEAGKTGGVKGMFAAQLKMLEREHLEFFKSLGYPETECANLFRLIQRREELGMESVHIMIESQKSGNLGNHESAQNAVLQIDSQMKADMGAENYERFKYWQNTRQDRETARAFRMELEAHALGLTQQQEAAVVDALYQERKNEFGFALSSPLTTSDDKSAYIEKVKRNLAGVLDGSAMKILDHHLRKAAEKSLVPAFLKE